MRARLTMLVLAGALVAPSAAWGAGAPATADGWRGSAESPAGYRAERVELAPGVEHLRLSRDGDQAVNVAFVARDAEVALRTVSSFGRIAGRDGRVERTSAMCRRVSCLVAVNGDFFADGVPVGAVASGGELLRTSTSKHHLLMVDAERRLAAGQIDWSGKLVPTDLGEILLDGVNAPRRRNELVLYTPAYGARTGSNPHGAELVLRIVAPRDHRPRLGETAIVRMARLRWAKGDTSIPADGLVLSGHGRAAALLEQLWERVQRGDVGRDALLRLDAEQRVAEAIGGSPILLRDGAVWFANDSTAFVRSRAPRTAVGWNDEGDTWLVTIDGRQPGHAVGMSLLEAARLLQSLGATDAINLDGGGSTTFVVGGTVANRPSDRLLQVGETSRIVPTVGPDVEALNVERPVANALAVVPVSPDGEVAASPPELHLEIPRSETVALPVPSETDPASNPFAALPAIVTPPAEEEPPGRSVPLGAAAALNVAVLIGVAVRARARRIAA